MAVAHSHRRAVEFIADFPTIAAAANGALRLRRSLGPFRGGYVVARWVRVELRCIVNDVEPRDLAADKDVTVEWALDIAVEASGGHKRTGFKDGCNRAAAAWAERAGTLSRRGVLCRFVRSGKPTKVLFVGRDKRDVVRPVNLAADRAMTVDMHREVAANLPCDISAQACSSIHDGLVLRPVIRKLAAYNTRSNCRGHRGRK